MQVRGVEKFGSGGALPRVWGTSSRLPQKYSHLLAGLTTKFDRCWSIGTSIHTFDMLRYDRKIGPLASRLSMSLTIIENDTD